MSTSGHDVTGNDALRVETILGELNITINKDAIIQIVDRSDIANNRDASTMYRIGWLQISQLVKDFYNPPKPVEAESKIIDGIKFWRHLQSDSNRQYQHLLGGPPRQSQFLVSPPQQEATSQIQWLPHPPPNKPNTPQPSFTIMIMPNTGGAGYFNMQIGLSKYSLSDAEKVYSYLLNRVMEYGNM